MNNIKFRIEIDRTIPMPYNGQLGTEPTGSVDDVFENLFASKDWRTSFEIAAHNDQCSFDYDGGSCWQSIVIIESLDELEGDLERFKNGRSVNLDNDEVFIKKGRVLKRFSFGELYLGLYNFGEWVRDNLGDSSYLDSLPEWVHEKRRKLVS